MTIPKNFGISKIGHMRGEEDSRYAGREGTSGSARAWQKADDGGVVTGAVVQASSKPGLSFELNSASDAVALLQPPSFNVLYVSTPKVPLLQTPQYQAVAQLWEETVELLRPLLRFGFPQTSLKTKCPYYDDKLFASEAGALLATDRTRTVIQGVHNGHLHAAPAASSSHHKHQQLGSPHQEQPHQQQQQEPTAVGSLFGLSALAYFASHGMGGKPQQQQAVAAAAVVQQQAAAVEVAQSSKQQDKKKQKKASKKQQQQEQAQAAAAALVVVEEQHPERAHGTHSAIPKGKLLVPDIPSGSLVLALNLMSYWAITKQSRRSSMGGTSAPWMPGMPG